MKAVFIFMMCIMSNAIFANWNQSAFDMAEKFKCDFDDAFTVSAKTLCNVKAPSYDSTSKNQKDIFIESDHLREKLRVKLVMQKVPAPLMMVIPGLFNNVTTKMPKKLTQRFFNLGYHVVAFPNPFGTEFLSKGASFPPFSLEKEASVYLNALKFVIENIDKDFITGVHIAGVSYGGLLSTVVSGLDSMQENPVGFNTTTAYSPPFDLVRSFKLIDGLMEETEQTIGLLVRYPSLYRLCKAKGSSDLKSKDPEEIKKIVVHYGFKRELISSVSQYDSTNNFDLYAASAKFYEWAKRKIRKQWEKEISFAKYYSDYAPEVYEHNCEGAAQIMRWIDIITKNGGNARILTSDDDFVNDKDVWPTDDPRIIILKGGGHYGIRTMPWLDDFLETVH